MKFTRIMIIGLVFIIVSSMCISCAKKEKNNPGDSSNIPKDTVIIDNFENYAPGFQDLKFVNDFGRVSVNTDMKYVKSGKQSAFLQPLGNYSNGSKPILYFQSKSSIFNYDFSDFSFADYITMEVFNAEDNEINMYFGLINTIRSAGNISVGTKEEWKLNTGWNEIIYDFNLDDIAMFVDYKNVAGFYISFDNVHARNVDAAPKIYIDDILLHNTKEEQIVSDFIILDNDENWHEICDFEKDYQNSIVKADCYNPKTIPDLEVIPASTVGLTAPKGDNILKCVLNPGDAGGHSWPAYEIPEVVIQKSYLKQIEVSDYDDYSICFDVYNGSSFPITFYIEFYEQGLKNRDVIGIIPKPKEWTHFEMKLNDVLFTNLAKWKNPGSIRIAWDEYGPDKPELPFYFDNFSIVKK